MILLMVFHYSNFFGQDYTVKTFTTENGLPHNNVRTLVADSSGFLWIGTWDGLSRYDGYEFKNYYHIPGDSTSLPYFSVSNICLDGSNTLWVITDLNAIAKFNRSSDNFTLLEKVNGEKLENVRNICTDESGDLWLIEQNALFRQNHTTKKFEKYSFSGSSEIDYLENAKYWITKESDSRIWLAGRIVYEIIKDDNNKNLTILKKYNIKSPFANRRLSFDYFTWYSLYISETGKKWIFSNTGLFSLNEKTGDFNEYKGVIPIEEFIRNKVFFWGTINNGLFFIRSGLKSIIHIPGETSQMVKGFLSQGNNIAWFSNTSFTGNSLGLSRIIFTPSYFKKYCPEEENDKLPAVYSVTKDKNDNIWLGIRGRDHVVQITHDNEIKKTCVLPPELFSSSGQIRSMVKTEKGIWIGYYTDLLLLYDYNTGKFIRHHPECLSFRAIVVNREGNLYIGTNELKIYYPTTGKTEIIWDTTSISIMHKFYIDDKEILWGAMPRSQILSYNPLTKKVKVFKVSPDPYNIEDIISGDNMELWLALLGGGVCRFNPVTGKSVFYTTANGLSNNTTYSLLKDKSGNIWISTDNGISRLNPPTGNIRRFNQADGLDITEFNSGASFIAGDGEFFFGGMGGVVSFYPDSINTKGTASSDQKIILTGLTVSGKTKTLPKPVHETDTIILQTGENNFYLTFSSTDFVSSESTLYRYRLKEINDSWIVTDHTNRNINYSNLKPGYYHLNLQTTNRNSEWTATRSLVIRICPYFYQTKVFVITITLLFLSILLIIILLYIRQIKQKERQKQDELRLQSLRGQMNPHFIFNSLNSINYFISNNDKVSANRYIADFSRLIRSILSNMGSDYVPFENEMSSLQDYLKIEHLRFGDKFNYEINTENLTITTGLEVFPGLVQPVVENAIWHGVRALEKRKGFIKVKFLAPGPDSIKCVIEDDGIGRRASLERRTNTENHKSKGISIVTERLQLISKLRKINYNLEITDIYPNRGETGTRVEIDIPIKTR